MQEILEELQKQDYCSAPSALWILMTMVRSYLKEPIPNVLKKPFKEEYDFIVVGSGSSGSIVASRLSENPDFSVLLLEAGGEEPEITRVPCLFKTDGMFNTAIEWGFKTEPHPEFCDGKPCTYGRAKMLGGCDAHNGMWYLKGHNSLFDDWCKTGVEGWSYEEMQPYFEKRASAREELDDGTEADMSVERFPYLDDNIHIIMKAYEEVGYPEPDKNGDHCEGYKTTSKNGERVSVNKLYIEKMRFKRPNLQVSTESMVTKIIIDPSTKTAMGVEMLDTEGGKNELVEIKARKEVIIAAGIINSPKLLQLSGIGPEEHLNKLGIEVIKNLKVGYNFMNHPTYNRYYIRLTSTAQIPSDCKSLSEDILKYMTQRTGPLAASGAFNSYLLANSSYSTKEVPDLLFSFNPSIEGMGLDDPLFCTCYYNKLRLGVMAGTTKCLGTILIKSKDPLESPCISLGFDDRDYKMIAEGCVIAHKCAHSKVFKKYGFVPDDTPDPRCKGKKFGTYDYWLCAIKGKLDLWLHGMASCKMGTKDDPGAVVDQEGNVHGIQSLRVVDASTLPLEPNININALVMASAERYADFIKKQYY